MNRRLFAAMAAALPTGMAGTAFASTPTPVSHPDSIAATVIHEFLTRVLEEGDLAAIAEMFTPEEPKVKRHIQFFENLLQLGGRGENSQYFKLALCFGDNDRALAFGYFGPFAYAAAPFFMGIWLEDGKISTCQFLTDLNEYLV